MMKKLQLLLLLMILSIVFACAPTHREPKPIPLYKDTLIEEKEQDPC